MRIFLMGGSGLVGARLIERLKDRGDQVMLLTRRPDEVRTRWGTTVTVVGGDPKEIGPWMDAAEACDVAVNLTGEGVFNRRWSAAFKQEMYYSRIKSTENIVRALTKKPVSVDGAAKVLVNASAIGYYGPHGDEELDENSPPADDYLARLCVDWEKAALAATGKGVRTAVVRIGAVLDPRGGALKQMAKPFRMFMGGPVGSGKQYVSWIHHADLVGIILVALDRAQATGPINGTAPNPVTNKEFSKALGRALHRPSVMPAPRIGLRVMLGEVAAVVTTGQRVIPRRALALGYAFQFPGIDAALGNLYP